MIQNKNELEHDLTVQYVDVYTGRRYTLSKPDRVHNRWRTYVDGALPSADIREREGARLGAEEGPRL